jgi:hypothetical protein
MKKEKESIAWQLPFTNDFEQYLFCLMRILNELDNTPSRKKNCYWGGLGWVSGGKVVDKSL